MESKSKQRTRSSLHQALFFLLEQKSLEKIKVSDITKTVHINRSTFYEYYPDMRSLIDSAENTVLLEFKLRINSTAENICALHTAEIFSQTIELMSKIGDAFFLLIGPNGDSSFSAKFIETIKPILLQYLGISETTPELDTLITFEISGAIGVFNNWYASGKAQPLENVIKMVQRILYAGINIAAISNPL